MSESEQFNPYPVQEGIEHGPHPSLEMTGEEGPFTPTQEKIHQIQQNRKAVWSAVKSGHIGNGEWRPRQAVAMDELLLDDLHEASVNETDEEKGIRIKTERDNFEQKFKADPKNDMSKKIGEPMAGMGAYKGPSHPH